MIKGLICLSVVWFVCYQAHQLQVGHPGKGSGAMAAGSPWEVDQSCQKPSNIWAFVPLVGKSLTATLTKKYLHCLKKKAVRRVWGTAVHVAVKVFLAMEFVVIVSITKMIVKRIFYLKLWHRNYVE